MNLVTLGWNDFFKKAAEADIEQGYKVGRISLEHKKIYRILTEQGELLGEVSGKLRHQALEREDYPAVGDWVVISARPEEGKATIHRILPRQSKFSRKVAGTITEEQIVATNIDTLFLVNALNKDFNPRRIERYLIMAWESGANPVIILSKSDLADNIEEKILEVEKIALGVPVHVISATEDRGLDQLKTYLKEGQTLALLGSSGVGKSTLANKLYGEQVLHVNTIRDDDDKGRHTTTHRELIILPDGGIIIDTPGMRELQLWEADQSLTQSFSDIEDLALQCRFKDCSHQSEPGCAVEEAIQLGELTYERFESYRKLQKELAFLERKADVRARQLEKEKRKKISGDRTRVHRR